MWWVKVGRRVSGVWQTGLEFREGSYVLNMKDHKIIKAGMTFNVSVGFNNIKVPKAADEKEQT